MKKKGNKLIGILVGILLLLAVVGIIIVSNRQNQITNNHLVEKPNQEENEEVTGGEEENILDESKAVQVWTTSNLNLRQLPDNSSTVIKVLTKGTELKKYEDENGWAHVRCGDDIGYVSTQYLTSEEPKEDTTDTTTKIEVIPGQHRNPNSAVVVIDPGHQLKGDSNKEPNGPNSSTLKARVTSGTTGVASGVAEYIMNLEVSLKLKKELENRGYTVYMTRSTHDVNISNKERAEYATTVGADIAVRIHGNGSTNTSANGAEAYVPSSSNPYVSHLAKASQSLGQHIIDKYCEATGFKNRGVFASDTMTGMNWSTVPVAIIELGFMSNAEEDLKMQDATMQNNMVQGIANGIDAYFGF